MDTINGKIFVKRQLIIMDNYAKYFGVNRPKPKWFLGDRVSGRWNKIPFIGTVMIDNMVSEDVGQRVIVQLDLPLQYKKEYKNFIEVKQKDIKKLVKF